MKIKLLLLGVIYLLISPIKAQSFRKYSNEFLNIGADARAFGMGNNVIANIQTLMQLIGTLPG